MLIYDMDGNTPIVSLYWTEIFQKTHSHRFWEIIFLCDGSFINVLNQKERQMNKYDVVLVHPKDVHRLKPHSNKVGLYNLSISVAHFTDFCNHIYKELIDELSTQEDLYITLSAHRHEKIFNFIHLASTTTNKEEAQKNYNIALSMLLPEFIKPKDLSTQSTVSQAIAIMTNPSNMHLSVKEIAGKLGYTPEHLTRLFKKEINDTPSNYFHDLKMQHAKLLLQQTDHSVEKIAKTIGISSIQHFYRMFKDYYKILPSTMRKKQ